MLPDDVLLSIFDFCADKNEITEKDSEAWQTLVHVCHRWRSVVLESPRRLNLRLVCTSRTPARKTLDAWPAFPLVIQCDCRYSAIESIDNIVAVLERRDRVCQIILVVFKSSHLENVSAAMQKPFRKLTRLQLWSYDDTMSVLTDSFLDGYAPRLRILSLLGIPFPGLTNLLLFTIHLVHLHLFDVPHSGYFSPEAMVTALSSLTRLELFLLEFHSPRSLPDPQSRLPPPPTRFVLPVLTHFAFKGVGEYLDDLVAGINAPQLYNVHITFFNQIVFDSPQFIQFINRTPTLKLFEKASVAFKDGVANINLSSRSSCHEELDVRIPCKELDWQISSVEQVLTSCLPPLPTLEDLYISENPYWQSDWQDNIENTLWLELLHPFTAVKNLYLSKDSARRIWPSLQEIFGDAATEVLPALEIIFLEGLQEWKQEDTKKLVAMRTAGGHPITISHWNIIFPDKRPPSLTLLPVFKTDRPFVASTYTLTEAEKLERERMKPSPRFRQISRRLRAMV